MHRATLALGLLYLGGGTCEIRWYILALCRRPADRNKGVPVSAITVLVADDYRNWRHQVSLLLQARPELKVICEVSDGSEAVQKAEELQPDLIVLDIGLPELNGIEAARRIRLLSPNSRIVFLSADRSLDVVQVALSTGAQGYVCKARASGDLIPAIEAAVQGQHFVSSMIKGYEFAASSVHIAPHRHEVLFYSEDSVFLRSLTDFIATALDAGDVAVAIVTESHHEGLARMLKARGVDVDNAIREGTFIPVDTAKSLSTFMVNGMPDSDQYLELVGDLIRAAAKAGKREHARIAAWGKISPVLWAEGNADAAVRLEQITEQLIGTCEVDILCAYPMNSFNGQKDDHILQTICAQHSAVFRQ
jgi:DNA-binding NarL/FixJ family response regulator